MNRINGGGRALRDGIIRIVLRVQISNPCAAPTKCFGVPIDEGKIRPVVVSGCHQIPNLSFVPGVKSNGRVVEADLVFFEED